MVVIDFDPNEIEEDVEFEPIPDGEYVAVLKDSDGPIETQNGRGKYIKLEFQIVDGKYSGRRIFENLNLWRYGNTEKDRITERIARANLKSLYTAVGVTTAKDTAELHDKPFTLQVKIKDEGEYGIRNRVAGYKPLNNNNTPEKSVPWA